MVLKHLLGVCGSFNNVKMAAARCLIVYVCVLCHCAYSSQVFSVLKDVQHCFNQQLEPCLVDHTIETLLDVTNLTEVSSKSEGGRGSSFSVEERLFEKLIEAFGISNAGILEDSQAGRADPVLRTFNKAWKYIIPLLIGVKLKLATFVPFVLTILTLMAKSAFVSGNLALLLTGLNIVLKYWYPKMGEAHHAIPHHSSYHQPQDELGHHQNVFKAQGYHQPNLFQNHHQEQFLNNYENLHTNHQLSESEFGTNGF